MSTARQAFAREARKIHRDSLFNATSHFEAADAHRRVHLVVRVLIVLVGAVGGLGALKDPGLGPQLQLVLVGCSSALAGLLGGLLAVLKPAEAQTAHEVSGKQFKSLQHDARRAHEIFARTDTDSAFQQRVSELMARYNDLNESAPQIPDSAYAKAKQKVASGEFENVPSPHLDETSLVPSDAPAAASAGQGPR
jgi:hypothetical protein